MSRVASEAGGAMYEAAAASRRGRDRLPTAPSDVRCRRRRRRRRRGRGRGTGRGEQVMPEFLRRRGRAGRDHRQAQDRSADATTADDQVASAPEPGAEEPAAESTQVPMVEASLLAERTADLQRLQAEYANYRKRAERERLAAGELAVGRVLADFLPVLDDLDRAEAHGDLTGGLKAIADKLEASLRQARAGRVRRGGRPVRPVRPRGRHARRERRGRASRRARP